jgi:hypothetical protein
MKENVKALNSLEKCEFFFNIRRIYLIRALKALLNIGIALNSKIITYSRTTI